MDVGEQDRRDIFQKSSLAARQHSPKTDTAANKAREDGKAYGQYNLLCYVLLCYVVVSDQSMRESDMRISSKAIYLLFVSAVLFVSVITIVEHYSSKQQEQGVIGTCVPCTAEDRAIMEIASRFGKGSYIHDENRWHQIHGDLLWRFTKWSFVGGSVVPPLDPDWISQALFFIQQDLGAQLIGRSILVGLYIFYLRQPV